MSSLHRVHLDLSSTSVRLEPQSVLSWFHASKPLQNTIASLLCSCPITWTSKRQAYAVTLSGREASLPSFLGMSSTLTSSHACGMHRVARPVLNSSVNNEKEPLARATREWYSTRLLQFPRACGPPLFYGVACGVCSQIIRELGGCHWLVLQIVHPKCVLRMQVFWNLFTTWFSFFLDPRCNVTGVEPLCQYPGAVLSVFSGLVVCWVLSEVSRHFLQRTHARYNRAQDLSSYHVDHGVVVICRRSRRGGSSARREITLYPRCHSRVWHHCTFLCIRSISYLNPRVARPASQDPLTQC